MHAMLLTVALALPRDAVSLADRDRFPVTGPQAQQLRWFLNARLYWLRHQQACQPSRWLDWELLIEDAAARRHLFDALEDAATPHLSTDYRLQALERARQLLGEEAWQAGALPGPLP